MPVELDIPVVSPTVFVPGVDKVSVEIGVVPTRKFDDMSLQVTDAEGKLVFRSPVKKSQKTENKVWDGRGDPSKPSGAKGFVTPLGSPYQVRLYGEPIRSTPQRGASLARVGTTDRVTSVVDSTASSGARTQKVEVKLHSVKLEVMKWEEVYTLVTGLAGGAYPTGATEQVAWVQYRLNDLGYFAGPVNGTRTPDLDRAIRRYRLGNRKLYKRQWKIADDYASVTWAGAGLEALCDIDEPLINELSAGTGRRTVFDPGVVNEPDKNPEGKLYLDGGRYYVSMEELFRPEPRKAPKTSKRDAEDEWYTRPIVPLKATVRLSDKNGEPVASPAAGGMRIQWGWADVLEDADLSGARTDAKQPMPLPRSTADQPSATEAYVKAAMEAARQFAAPPEARRNCRAIVGGLVTGQDQTNRYSVFEPMHLFPFESAAPAPTTTTWADPSQHRSLLAAACVYFRPSTVAGDTYKISAELLLPDSRPDLRGVKSSASSGKIVLWRRERVAAQVSWPKMQGGKWDGVWRTLHGGTGGVDWDKLWKTVRQEYAHCFIEIVGPEVVKAVADFPGFDQKFSDIIDEVVRKFPTDEYWKAVGEAKSRGGFAFNPAALYPETPTPPSSSNASMFVSAINQAIVTFMSAEAANPPTTGECEKLKRAKARVSLWGGIKPTDEPREGEAPIPKGGEGFLKDACNHFLTEFERVSAVVTEGGTRQFFRKTSDLGTETELKPFVAPPPSVSADAVNNRVTLLLATALASRTQDADLPLPNNVAAVKKLLAEWKQGKDAATGIIGDGVLTAGTNDATLKAAGQHFDKELSRLTKGFGANLTFKALKLVKGSADVAPLPVPPATATNETAINNRINDLLRDELAARTADADSTHENCPRLQDVGKLLDSWAKKGTDFKIDAVPSDATLSGAVGDPLLKAAGEHFLAELRRLCGSADLGPERKVLRYKSPAQNVNPYSPSSELAAQNVRDQEKWVHDHVEKFVKVTQIPVFRALEEELLKECDPGMVIFDFYPHPDVTLNTGSGTKTYVAPIFASANGNGFVLMDQAHLQIYRWDHLYPHELAHCLFLRHWKNSPGYDLMDHDHADDNCQMSYAMEVGNPRGIVSDAPHYAVGKYTPHFCGKCNLKLRGWNIRAKTGGRNERGWPLDLLPETSDLSKRIVVPPPALVPIPTYARWTDPNLPLIPNPKVLREQAEAMLKILFPSDDASKLWLNPSGGKDDSSYKRPSKQGAVAVIGNPEVDGTGANALIKWQMLPAKVAPQTDVTVWPASTSQKCHFPEGSKQNWEDNLDCMATLGGRSTNEGIQLVTHYVYGEFTDLIHETCHFFQKLAAESWLQECVTDIFGSILCLRIRATMANDDPHLSRFQYVFNPSYMESVLCGIDQWLPRMGLVGLAEYYVKEKISNLDDIVIEGRMRDLSDLLEKSDASSTLDKQAISARNLYRSGHTGVDGDIRTPNNSGGTLRHDIEQAVLAAPAALRDDLRRTIHDFLDALEAQTGFSQEKRDYVAPLTGLRRHYALARLARRTRKQIAYTTALRHARAFRQQAIDDEMELRKGDAYIQDIEDALAKLNVDPVESTTEFTDPTGRTRSTYY